jgi:ubiquitin C-terminal hydrolase
MALNRIEMDYETFTRKKINDRFEFPLELDLSPFLTQELTAQLKEKEDAIYELKSIVIHRGGPYGGHYYAYIKDDMKQGVWDCVVPEKFNSEPI